MKACTLYKTILSADLLPFLELGSIPNFQTNNPNSKRGKNGSKTKEKKITPCHLSSFSSGPLHGSIFFVFSRCLPLCQSNNISC